MKKSLVIFLNQNFMTKSGWEGYQINKFSEYSDVIIYELANLINPEHFSIVKNKKNSSLIKRFYSLKKWKEHFNVIINKKKYKKILIINSVKPKKIKSYLVLKELSKFNGPIVEYQTQYMPYGVKFKKNLNHYINIMINIKYFKRKIEEKVSNYLYKFISFKNYFYLVSGSAMIKKFKNEKNIIGGFHWDYNNTLTMKKSKVKKNKNYVVFLENMSPLFPGDAKMFPGLINISAEEFYPHLCKFFDKIESLFNTRVVIASHPKSRHKKNPSYFGYRKTFLNNTKNLIQGSRFVLAEPSTALAYVIRYKKPCLMVFASKTLTSNYNKNEIYNACKFTGMKPFNIENKFSKKQMMKSLKVNFNNYKKFEKEYLYSVKNNVGNFNILKEKFL